MKKITPPISLLSLIILFFFSDFVYGQTTEVKKEFWENGHKRLEEHYKDGKKEGPSAYFYESGIKMFEVYYKYGENG